MRSRFKKASIVTPFAGVPNFRSASIAPAAFSGDGSIRRSRSFVLCGSVYFITAYPPTTRYRTPASFKSRNRSLKFELISTESFQRRRRDRQVPGRRKNLRVSQCLPELDVKLTPRFIATGQSFHDKAFVHFSYYLPPAPLASSAPNATPPGRIYKVFTL